MIENRPIDELVPVDGNEIQPGLDTDGGYSIDPSAAEPPNTADVAGAWGADQTTTSESVSESAASAQQLPGPEPRVPATTVDQPARQLRTNEESLTPLFAADAAKSFRSRWQDIQTSFVDEPGRAVENADSLVAEVMQQLARTFAEERSKLEPQLVQGEEISTEELRMAIRRYRSFFDRLLSI